MYVICVLEMILILNIPQPDGRVSLLRGAFKDASVLAVAGQYGLSNGCAQKVTDLKDDDIYIYPLDKVHFSSQTSIPLY